MRIREAILVALALLAAGCVPTATSAPAPAPVAAASRPVAGSVGLALIGSTAAALTSRFGQPDLDIREGTARKLQFAGPACVLDAYIYPSGTREPVVTHVDTRLPDGRDMDQASCVAALSAARQRR